MYLGEVSVAQNDLDSFLSVAQDLCIKGLTQQETNNPQPGPSHVMRNRPSMASAATAASTAVSQHQQPPSKKPRMAAKNGALPTSTMSTPKREPKMEEEQDEHEDIEVLDDDDPSQIEEYDEYYDEEAGPSDDSKGKDSFFFSFKNLQKNTKRAKKKNEDLTAA